ncbi:pantothenate transporter liz1 [Nannizzia gypsea CBS 118893]|uniref:Pantothenate transporter liz1 n=1 Tax=Arthroderma gypseum (strain ATCC MYA-4604 / CBS 118893) TaxID=535722 RepID=E4V6V7_ARTGP|nr:pantothenate transporter liz1 [Nannizzia gypsea CBS 118893]EFQ96823.1 pantothenate transporter liz1 [Nannizzia gypsea CBS 118893]
MEKQQEPAQVEVLAVDAERGASPGSDPSPDAIYVDPELERRVVRKLDTRLLGLVSVLAVLAYLDRANIGNARIAGMDVDLQLYGDRFDWLSTVFFIPFVIFHFQVVMWKRFRHDYMLVFTVFLWGLTSTLHGVARNWEGVMALRFFLGIAEAIFSTGTLYFFSFYYRREEIGLRCAIYLSSAPLSSSFSGALAYAITSGTYKIASWRVLFLVEGIPSILMAPLALYLIPPSPDKANFFTPEEKEVAVARLKGQVGHVERVGSIDWNELGATILDINVWFPTVITFSAACCWGSLPIFLPTIIKSMGFSAVTAQGLTAPPYLVAALITIVLSWYSDRYQQRGAAVAFAALVAAAGYAILAVCESTWVCYLGVFLAAAGLFSGSACLSPWIMNNQGTDSRRGFTVAIMGVIGMSGSIPGSRLYPLTDGPRYVKGNAVCAGVMFFQFLLAVVFRWLLVRQNRKLDKLYGTLEEQKLRSNLGENERVVGGENYSPNFRYVL